LTVTELAPFNVTVGPAAGLGSVIAPEVPRPPGATLIPK
jgi:hypothetical protein